jgi:flagellar hook-length control protein FliK
MSVTGTVVATSAEGAGDMPSSAPATSGNSSPDGTQPFSEVLSLSAPDLPGSASCSSTPSPPAVPDAAPAQADTTAAPTPETPQRGSAGSPGERARGRAGPRGPGLRPARSAAGSLAPPPTDGQAVRIPPPASARAQDETAPSDASQSQGAPLPAPAIAAPAAPVPATVIATSASRLPPVSLAGTAVRGGDDAPPTPAVTQVDGPGPATDAGSLTLAPATLGAGSNQGRPQGSDAPAGRTPAVTGVGGTEGRDPANHGVPTGLTGLPAGPVRIQATGAAPGAAASVLTAASTGTPATAAAEAEEVSGLAEFPDGAGGTAGASVDVSDLAASISRPLAGGSGDYSVQVSLHPPELGQVRALLSLQGDVLHVTLTPEHANGFEALSDAMPSLHDQLAGGGVEVNVTLGQPGDPPGGAGRGAADSGPAGSASSNGATPAATPSASPITDADPGRIHLVL